LNCALQHLVFRSALCQSNRQDERFSADNAAPVATPTQANPCAAFVGANGLTTTDEETATITDGHGHTAQFFLQIAG
jgi:hypothetical protein